MKIFKLKGRADKDSFSLGLDLGSSATKIVKLKLLKDGAQLEGIDLIPPLAELKSIVTAYGVKKVNISVSGTAAIIRYVNFPKMNDAELKQALKFEAQKHIPFSLTDVNLDSCILSQDPSSNTMLVMLAVAKKELVNQRLKLLQDTGIKVNLIDIDSLALVNAFNFNYPLDKDMKNKAVALLNIGASFSNLNILEDAIPRLSRDIHIAGNNFTQRIQETLGIDLKGAEDLKLNPDKERLNKITLAVETGLTPLASELRSSFDYYESQGSSTVTKILLSGGGSLFLGIKDSLANLLGIDVEYWDPFKNIEIPKKINLSKIIPALNNTTQEVTPYLRQFAVSVGLALRK
jgi:type IV pilus assembly protein PilM